MILLDTNVVSESMTREPNARVRAWLDSQITAGLFISSITLAELLFGIGVLPEGRRKMNLHSALLDVMDLYASRILDFDTAAARRHAQLAVEARARGKGFPIPDGYIAAIAAAHGFAVASRDTTAFQAANLTIINPWTFAG